MVKLGDLPLLLSRRDAVLVALMSIVGSGFTGRPPVDDSPENMCIMTVTTTTRDESEPHFVVRSTGRMALTDAVDWSAFQGRSSAVTPPVRAYFVEAFPHGTSRRNYSAAPATPVVLIPWGIGGTCEVGPARLSLEAGDLAFVLPSSLRDSSLWVEGYPTYDVLFAWEVVFPRQVSGAEPSDEATAWDYAEFFEHVPTAEEWERDTAEAYLRLETWVRQRRFDRRSSIDDWLGRLREFVGGVVLSSFDVTELDSVLAELAPLFESGFAVTDAENLAARIARQSPESQRDYRYRVVVGGVRRELRVRATREEYGSAYLRFYAHPSLGRRIQAALGLE